MTTTALLMAVLDAWFSISGQDLRIRAQQAVKARHYVQARALYQRLAERSSDNKESILWVARLSGWIKDYPAALENYDLVLAREHNDFEALLGKAYVLMWEHRYIVAGRLLRRAEALSPNSAELRLALARFFHYQNQEKEARRQVLKALEISPSYSEAKELEGELAPSHPFEMRMAYGHDSFSFSTPGHMGSVSIGYVGELNRVDLHYEDWIRFDQHVRRAGLSFNRRVLPNWWIHAGGLEAPGATVLARHEYTAGFSHALPHRILVGADYRYLHFSAAEVQVLSPSVEYYFKQPLWIQATFSRSWTAFRLPGAPEIGNDAFSTQLYRQVSRRVLMRAGYAWGNESFSALSIDRLGKFQANTYIGGVELRFSPVYSSGVFYSYQQRSNGFHESAISLQLRVRQ